MKTRPLSRRSSQDQPGGRIHRYREGGERPRSTEDGGTRDASAEAAFEEAVERHVIFSHSRCRRDGRRTAQGEEGLCQKHFLAARVSGVKLWKGEGGGRGLAQIISETEAMGTS